MKTFFLLIIALAPYSIAAASQKDLPEKILFEVVDFKSGQKLFTGDEIISAKDGLIVKTATYFDLSSRPVQTEVVTYAEDSLETKKYVFENSVTGEKADASVTGDSIELSHIANKTSASSEKAKIKVEKNQFLGKVLHHIIVRNWKKIVEGKPEVFGLLVPFKLTTIQFQVANVGEKDGLKIFRLQPDSWMIRKFVDNMDFYYSEKEPKTLAKYIGPTTIHTDGDDSRKIQINFRY